jgi:hypothetical protein
MSRACCLWPAGIGCNSHQRSEHGASDPDEAWPFTSSPPQLRPTFGERTRAILPGPLAPAVAAVARMVGSLVMSRAIAFVACGFAVAACSFLGSPPPTDDLRFESEPPAAEVKTSSGQTCRTPCELPVQLVPELSATFTLNGHVPQTVLLKPVPSQPIGAPRFLPNPVYVELQPAAGTPPTEMPMKKIPMKKKPAIAARTNNAPVASDDPAAPPPTAGGELAMPSTLAFPGIVRSVEEAQPTRR